ncbi:MAG: hypothetical protein RR709_09750, partial [Ruthenibacterium sp.]
LQAFLQISIPVSIIIAILAMLHPFLRKRYAAKWRYWAWLLLALRLLLPWNVFTYALARLKMRLRPV